MPMSSQVFPLWDTVESYQAARPPEFVESLNFSVAAVGARRASNPFGRATQLVGDFLRFFCRNYLRAIATQGP